jgi:hypothetical protein
MQMSPIFGRDIQPALLTRLSIGSNDYLYGTVTLYGRSFQNIRLVTRVLKSRPTCSLDRSSEFGVRYIAFDRLYSRYPY